jgi:hypothetical protein
LFAELLAGALERTGAAPTPVAIAYLVDLLAARVRETPGLEPSAAADALLAVRRPCEPSVAALEPLRRLGDGSLFAAGFFAENLARGPFGAIPTHEAGRCAYARLSLGFARLADERTWTWLYEELADRFGDFADLLAEVGERTRPGAPALAGLYARFLATGSERDRRRLLARGAIAPGIPGLRAH